MRIVTIDKQLFPSYVLRTTQGMWIVRKQQAIPRWTFVAPTDPNATEKFNMQKFMLNAHCKRGKPIFSKQNTDCTYMDECHIRGLITSPDNIKCVIKNAFLKYVNLNRIRDWISYFHKQEWLDSDLANDYLSDLQEQRKMLQDTFYHPSSHQRQ